MESENPCAYWIPGSIDAELDLHLRGKEGARVAECLDRASPVVSSRPGVCSVLMGDLTTVLAFYGIHLTGHDLGNEYRGFPGTVIAKLRPVEARELARQIKSLVETVGVDAIAVHEFNVLFHGDVESIRAGLDYLILALGVPNSYEAVIVRIN